MVADYSGTRSFVTPTVMSYWFNNNWNQFVKVQKVVEVQFNPVCADNQSQMGQIN